MIYIPSLTEDEKEDLQLFTNPHFIAAMERLVTAMDTTDFDIASVKTFQGWSDE